MAGHPRVGRIACCVLYVVLSGLFILPAWIASADTVPPQVTKLGRHVEFRMNGLACPFCLYGIKKRLNALKGVADIEASFEKATATLWIQPGSPTALWDLSDAVRRAGFSTDTFWITDAGRFRKEDAGYVFESMTNGERFQIAADSKLDSLTSDTAAGPVACSLTGHVAAIPAERKTMPLLVVEKFRVLFPSKK